jgi:hypothetical protein
MNRFEEVQGSEPNAPLGPSASNELKQVFRPLSWIEPKLSAAKLQSNTISTKNDEKVFVVFICFARKIGGQESLP